MKIKEQNALRIIEIARKTKTANWTKKEILVVLAKLKNGKSWDPGGLINELFKPGVIGRDLQEALLDLLIFANQKCIFLTLCKQQMSQIFGRRKGIKLISTPTEVSS